MSKEEVKEKIEQVIHGLNVAVDRSAIEKELQARLERKQSRIDELENIVDQQISEGQRNKVDKEKLEEYRRNEASLKYAESRTGGGRIRLPDESSRGFSTAQEMVDDLYDRKESKNEREAKKAEYDIQNLWRLTKPGLQQMMKRGF